MIKLSNVTLTYELFYSKENSLKGTIMNLLHKRQYTKKNKDSFDALKNISLTISAGERVGIIGRNGAGKSTLLKAIAGILKPQSGSIIVDGPTQPLIEVGAGFNPELSGRENIYLNGYMLGFTRNELKVKEQEIIDFTELNEFIDVPIKYYSSGMSVRLAFAIATSVHPHILLFDEMLAAGDSSFNEKAQKRMNNLLDSAKCIVIVSHDLNLIRKFCSRTIVINKGIIEFDGLPEEAVNYYLSASQLSHEQA
nr:ABC transporter ATP-binding protein [Bdellovibrio sp. CKG001]